jgi:predicted Zn-dependent protease
MGKLQRYQKRIYKYFHKISKIKFKKKLRNLLNQIGIETQEDFYIAGERDRILVFPCQVGILFIGKYDREIFNALNKFLKTTFESFFYSVSNLGEFEFSKELVSKGVQQAQKEKKEKHSEEMDLHPTNKFYQLLIELRKRNHLDIIIAITDLPIYSSNDNNIIFLFGEAHLTQKCCVISSLKLKEQFYEKNENITLFKQRLVKETLHEVGHLIIGKDHCRDEACVMSYSKNIEKVDRKSSYLCVNCKKKLVALKQKYNI